jgi:hypothetical protein
MLRLEHCDISPIGRCSSLSQRLIWAVCKFEIDSQSNVDTDNISVLDDPAPWVNWWLFGPSVLRSEVLPVYTRASPMSLTSASSVLIQCVPVLSDHLLLTRRSAIHSPQGCLFMLLAYSLSAALGHLPWSHNKLPTMTITCAGICPVPALMPLGLGICPKRSFVWYAPSF